MNAEHIPILQRSEKNDILTAIRAIGLDPREFDLDDSSTTEVKITHQRSSWWFVVKGGPAHYVGRYSIAEGLDRPYDAYSWKTFLERIDDWLQSLKRDLNTPDLWAELRSGAKWLGAGSSRVIENTPFTPEEQQDIARRLDKLAADVNDAFSFSTAQMQVLREDINYLVDASTRLGRKDWVNIFISVTVSFVLDAARAPEGARALARTFFQAIGLLYPELLIE